MRSKKRLTLITLMILSMLACFIGAVACGGGVSAEEAISMYILPQNETLVSEDFNLPKKIGKDNAVSVEWTSDKPAAIAIEDGNAESYTAKVSLQDEITEVKLTIKSGDASKDFTVRVDAFSVYTFMDAFVFPQKNTAVGANFEVADSITVQGKTATISWSVPTEYAAYLAVEGNTVKVTPPEDIVSVQIAATFTFNGDSKTQKYSFSVSPDLEHLQLINRIYSVTDYPVSLSGYVVHVYDAKIDATYGPNATFYMIDDNKEFGYYMYQLALNEGDVENFKEGVHVTVSGDKAKNYNGLWETTGKEVGKAVIDSEETINPRDYIYDFDVDLLAGVPSALWHESTLVSLTGWTVTSKASAKPTGADSNLFTIKNGDLSITVRISKYIRRTDDELNALLDVYDKVEVGSVVTVTGLLGNSNAFQIQPILASDIVVGGEAKTYENAPKLKAAVAKVEEAVKANFSSLVAAHKEVTMPTSESGVTISYRVAGGKTVQDGLTVKIDDNGKFTVDPTNVEKNYDVQVTYTIGDYTAYGFFKLHNWGMEPQEIVDTVKGYIEDAGSLEMKAAGDVKLPEIDNLGTTVKWSVQGTAPDWIEVSADGSTVTVKSLPAEETTLTLQAEITLGTAKATAKVTLKVSAAELFQHEGTVADPYTVEEAIKIANTLESDAIYSADGTPKQVAIAGYVSNVGKTYLPKEGDDFYMSSVYIADTADGKTSLQLYTIAYNNVVTKPAEKLDEKYSPFTKGDYVVVYGFIKNFKGTTPEIDKATVGDKAVNPTIETWEKVSVKGSHANPYTVAELKTLSIGSSKDGTEYYKVEGVVTPVYVKGIVTKKGSTQNYGIKEYYIADTAGDTANQIELYSINWDYVKSGTVVDVGDTVLVLGYPQKYKGGTVQVSSWKDEQNQYHNALLKEHAPAVAAGGENPDPQPTPDTPSLPDGKGIATAPVTVAEALDVAKQLAADAYLTKDGEQLLVYVKGFVIDIGEWSDQFGNFSYVWIADKADSTKSSADAIQVYRLYLDETNLKLVGDLAVGAEITLCGYLQNYKGKNDSAAPQFTYSGEKNDKHCVATAYTDKRTDEQKATAALNAIELPEKTNEDFAVPTSVVTGVTFAWQSDNDAIKVEGDTFTITRGNADVDVKLTATATCGSSNNKTREITVKVLKEVTLTPGAHTATFDFSTNFSTYAAEWSNSYAAKELQFSDVGTTEFEGKITLSNAAKASSSITDRPALASKNSVETYIMLYANGQKITSATFTLKQWSAKKLFSKLVVQTSEDGKQWTDVAETAVGDGSSNSIAITEDGEGKNNVFTYTNETGATYVRLLVSATGKDNVQFGISSVSLTINVPDAAAATNAPAEVALLPGKQF